MANAVKIFSWMASS